MGILDRVSTILRSNTNALLDQAEDPEKTIDQIIHDMSDALEQERGQVAEVIAQQQVLEADRDKNQALANEWGDKAELAVSRGLDDLAREALHRKLDYERNAQAYDGQIQAQAAVVAKLKGDLDQLQEKYDSTVRNRETLIARHRAAVAQQTVARTSAQLTGMDPTSDLARMDERIRLEEARAAAADEVAARPALDEQFAALQGDQDVNRELEALRAKVRGQLPDPVDAPGRPPQLAQPTQPTQP
jgi:phage shock protein A